MTALKSILFFILAPGTVAGFIPLALLRKGSQVETGFLSYLAFPLWLIGFAMLVWCFWDFVQKGKGTPAPIEPPKELVVSGLYNHVRNPMYVGVTSILIGHFLWFGFWNLLIYAAVIVLAFHSFVTLYEEPNLRQRFGAAYEAYCQRVPRWIPRLK
ncbi:MAG: isoprenylcysteine carboxyl methyltransferase [Anaerolineae bacterium]|nr:MAG: isoprenylcysteine carboxyl methyltransferase [Anaerolineae bacterium]WKZ44257.1 MAG: isoprenylcysteine carboxylmethyltransferase family protein [Anaerolineales bacterium]